MVKLNMYSTTQKFLLLFFTCFSDLLTGFKTNLLEAISKLPPYDEDASNDKH